MQKILNRIIRRITSLITTVLIMASPVAAVVYAAAPADAANSFSLARPAAAVATYQQPQWLDDLYAGLLGESAAVPAPPATNDNPEEDSRHGYQPR